MAHVPSINAQDIEFNYLTKQYEELKEEIDQSVQKVMSSGQFINGPSVKIFEKELSEYLNCKHVVSCGNGTDALMLCLMVLDLDSEAEVLTSPFSFGSAAEVIRLLGHRVVFSDIELETYSLDFETLKHNLTADTKAIILPHLFGATARDYYKIIKLAKEKNISVIDDVAQSLGANYTDSHGISVKTGLLADMAITSFFPTKNLSCMGDGGAIYTQNTDYAEKCALLSKHGMSPKYHYKKIGINSRLDTIQAAILSIKLKKLDEWITVKRSVAAFYNEELHCDNLLLPKNHALHTYNQYCIRVSNGQRDTLRQQLKNNDIPSQIYYPIGIHRTEAYKTEQVFEKTDLLCAQIIALPMSSHMPKAAQHYIITKINHLCKKY